jgi:serine/threonine protein kinase
MNESVVKTIGRYEVRAELGRGGFGRVYKAYDPTVGRMVAIKILTGEGQDLLTRFRMEAAAAGNLHHRNIVTVYDFGDYRGVPYIAMEFLEGEDLNQVIADGKPLDLVQKVRIMGQVAEGLDCAHRNGVVHRDVKPANIRLLPDGTVKILDFGIARLTRDGAGTRLTHQGDLIGTLLYMSPEQVTGSDVDALSDIFAYGVTYYELLTGTHPFQATDPGAVLYKITSEDPRPVRSIVPECPEALEHVVHRALHKDRELRYQTLRDLQFDSEPVLMELQQERASRLMHRAVDAFDGGDLDGAQTVLRQVLELDPGNRPARELRQTIQRELTRRVVQPRIESLLAAADKASTERRFHEACESLESAMRLDPDNADLRTLRDQARDRLDRHRACGRLIAEARQDFARGEIVAAEQKARQALELDSGSSEAALLV